MWHHAGPQNTVYSRHQTHVHAPREGTRRGMRGTTEICLQQPGARQAGTAGEATGPPRPLEFNPGSEMAGLRRGLQGTRPRPARGPRLLRVPPTRSCPSHLVRRPACPPSQREGGRKDKAATVTLTAPPRMQRRVLGSRGRSSAAQAGDAPPDPRQPLGLGRRASKTHTRLCTHTS